MISISGGKEIEAVLIGMPALFTHRVLQAAHADAAKPVVIKEHLLAPVGRTGKLADSIGIIKVPFSRATVIGEVNVGPRRGRFGGHAAHLVEFGTQKRSFRGANRGIMPKKPFAEPAFQQTQAEVQSRIAVALARKTLAFMRRTIKNYG
jgi:hypothetical protein